MISWARCILGQTQETKGEHCADTQAVFDASIEQAKRTSQRVSRWQRLIPAINVALLGLVIGLLVQRQLEHTHFLEQELEFAQSRVARLLSESRRLSEELSLLRSNRDALDEQVSSLSKRLSTSNDDLDHMRVELHESQLLGERLQKSNAMLEGQLAKAKADRDAARFSAARLERRQARLQRATALMREKLAFLARDYRRIAAHLAATGGNALSPIPARAELPDKGSGRLSSISLGSRVNAPGEVTLDPVVVQADEDSIADGPVSSLAPSAPSRISLHPRLDSSMWTQARTPIPKEAKPHREREKRGYGSKRAVPLRARLVEVNPAHQFIVIDKGSMDGVSEGMVFDVARGNTPVGQARVAFARARLSAADIIRTASSREIRIGDSAVERTSN